MTQEFDGWIVEMEWRDDLQGGPAGLLIRPVDPDEVPTGGVSSTVLRSINFREASAKLHDNIARYPDGWKSPTKAAQAKLDNERDRIAQVRDALASGITPEYIALLSVEYVTRVERGDTKPVEQIADDLGKGLQTVRGHLWRARREGYLTGSAGRKGGTLTEQSKAIVRKLPKPPKHTAEPTSLVDVDPPGDVTD